MLDCLIIGGGPAGLSAALYLARFKRTVALVDDDDSRARWIPESRNISLFGEGISGPEILRRGRTAVQAYGVTSCSGKVTVLAKTGNGFRVEITRNGEVQAQFSRFVLLASGAEDIAPEMPDAAGAVRDGLLRYCPVCDGFEASHRHVAVLGRGSHGAKETEFLVRSGFSDLTLLSFREALDVGAEERQNLAAAAVHLVSDPVQTLRRRGAELVASTVRGELVFDTVYAALGLKPRCGLARRLGAATDGNGALLVNDHLETSVPGLYAAGDVVSGLSQIVVGMGHAAVAATAIHNALGFPAATPGAKPIRDRA
jgi:thioredoxin reductase (NADPH)